MDRSSWKPWTPGKREKAKLYMRGYRAQKRAQKAQEAAGHIPIATEGQSWQEGPLAQAETV